MGRVNKVSVDLLKKIVTANFLDKACRDEETRFTTAEVMEMIEIAMRFDDEDNNRRS